MNSISNFGSSVGGVRNRADLGEFGSLSEKRESLQASQSKNLELSLTTKEGDTVTLSAGSFMDFASMSYDKTGRISNGTGSASARLSTREITLASGSQFSFSVKGSLSDQEMDDIENIVKTLDEVINKMATGNMDDAVAQALEMQDGYDTISGFEADLSTSSSYSFEKEVAKQAYYAGQGEMPDALNGRHGNQGVLGTDLFNQDQEIPDVAKDSSTRLMDMMLKELEKLQEQNQSVPQRAAEPVDQLLAHHMEQLKKMGEEKAGEKQDDFGINKNELNGNKNSLAGSQDKLQNDNNNSLDKNLDTLLKELDNARKGMAQEFRNMMPEAQDFRKMASSFFNNSGDLV